MTANCFDAIVIGAGLVGASVALGLVERGAKTLLLDEGDVALRAARGNFGLVWVQGKGSKMLAYAHHTRQSADLWPKFATELEAQTGIGIEYQRCGGIEFCVGETEMRETASVMNSLAAKLGWTAADYRILDRDGIQALLPDAALGEAVMGGVWCAHDAHVNPLKTLHALHRLFSKLGGVLQTGAPVDDIRPVSPDFEIRTREACFTAGKLVLAAGLGTSRLAAHVGMDVPLRPERGQILVTERLKPFFPFAAGRIRQTEDGTVMLGVTNEPVGFDTRTTTDAQRNISTFAVDVFPDLKDARLIRSWSALRILSPDGAPVYAQSVVYPGAYVVTCHSGVTLAAVHRADIAAAIAEDMLQTKFSAFSLARFQS